MAELCISAYGSYCQGGCGWNYGRSIWRRFKGYTARLLYTAFGIWLPSFRFALYPMYFCNCNNSERIWEKDDAYICDLSARLSMGCGICRIQSW